MMDAPSISRTVLVPSLVIAVHLLGRYLML